MDAFSGALPRVLHASLQASLLVALLTRGALASSPPSGLRCGHGGCCGGGGGGGGNSIFAESVSASYGGAGGTFGENVSALDGHAVQPPSSDFGENVSALDGYAANLSSGAGGLLSFYVYRAQGTANYPPKNINAGNLAGAMWYLQHEVVIQDPPKFGINRLLRYKVEVRAPVALQKKGLSFGVRFAYDSQLCTGPGDCTKEYGRYGYFVGCNSFDSLYPYPDVPSYYPDGIWYSLPGGGACTKGLPTGTSCTYSHSWPPEEVTLEELQGKAGAGFWADAEDPIANMRKVNVAAAMFATKYPKSPHLPTPACDFDFNKFWY